MVKMYNSTNLNHSNSPSPPTDESPSSEFQILNAPPSNLNGAFSHLNDLHFSINNAVFDVPAEEIQTQLRELLKENVELKETLHQNNVAMGEQFNKLLTWREEMAAVQEEHKKKFEETRLLIQQLRAENANLGKQCQRFGALQRENESSEAEMIVLKKQTTELEQARERLSKENERLSIVELQLKKELATAQTQQEALKAKNSRLMTEKQELVAINNELSSKLAACQSISPVSTWHMLEKSKEEDSFHQPFVTVSHMTKSSPEPSMRNDKKAVTDLLLQLHHEQNRVSVITNDYVEEQKKNLVLMKQVDELKKQLGTPTSPRQHSTDVLNDLKESEKTLNMATNYLERYKERCTSLEVWLGQNQGRLDVLGSKNDNEQVQQLREEMSSLRKTLIQQSSLNQEDRRNLLEARQNFESLLRDYQEVLKSWESFQQEQNSRGRQSEAYYEIQIKKLNEQIDNLTAKLVCNEETLQNKVEEMDRLRSQTQLSTQELEKIPILQAQVEVYQSDFRAERERSDQLYSEKGRLLAEKQDLQSRVRQLESELRHRNSRDTFAEFNSPRQAIYFGGRQPYVYADGAGSTEGGLHNLKPTASQGAARKLSTESSPSTTNPLSQKDRTRTTRSEQALPSSPDDNMYYCPKCNVGFTDFKPLENHVNRCLDRDDPFVS